MNEAWRWAAIGGCGGGAVTILSLFFGAYALGALPIAVVEGNAVHTYLMAHPDVLVEMTNELSAQQTAAQNTWRQAAIKKLGMKAFFDPRLAFVTGPADAKTTVVEFFDYNCPHCRASLPAMKEFYQTHKNARFAFIEYPILGEHSLFASRAAMAAREQPEKYVAFHFALMSQEGIIDDNMVLSVAAKQGLDVAKLKADMASPSVDLGLAATHSLAQAAGIDGTPTFIVDGKFHEGDTSVRTLVEMAKE